MNAKRYTLILSVLTSMSAAAEQLPAIVDRDNPTRASRGVIRNQAVLPLKSEAVIVEPTQQPALNLNSMIEVKQLNFRGGSRYRQEELIQPYADLIGKKVSLQQLLQATQRLTGRYKSDGYPLSFAYLPSNNFHQGVVQVVLVEGYLSGLNVNSNNDNIAERIRRLAQPMLAEKPLTQATFDRYSQLMSRIPNTSVIVNAAAPKTVSGGTPLDVAVNHPRNWNVDTSVDARRGEYTGFINATINGLTSYNEQLGIATLVPFKSDSRKRYLGLNYQQAVNDDGLQFQIKGSYYDQEPKNYAYVISVPNNAGDNIEIDAKKGQTQYTTGVQLNYPLLLSAQRQWNISGGVDYLDKSYDYRYQVKRNGQIITIPGLTEDTLNTRYTAGEINLTGQRIYSQSNWALRFNLRQGLGGSSDIKLPETDIRFTRWRFGADAGYFFTPKWRISTSIDGVWSDSHLPEPEKASYGGLRFGRGYPEGEISGDYGYGGQVELRYLQPIDARWVKTVQPYVVVDTGHTFNNSHYYRNRQIASYALGATFADNRHYSLSLEGARPIAELPSDVDKRDWRLNFSFSYNFGAP